MYFFPAGVYVGTLNLIASIPYLYKGSLMRVHCPKLYNITHITLLRGVTANQTMYRKVKIASFPSQYMYGITRMYTAACASWQSFFATD